MHFKKNDKGYDLDDKGCQYLCTPETNGYYYYNNNLHVFKNIGLKTIVNNTVDTS